MPFARVDDKNTDNGTRVDAVKAAKELLADVEILPAFKMDTGPQP